MRNIQVHLHFREVVEPRDPAGVRDLVAATGFFTAEEIAVAVELVDETLKDSAAGYHFIFAETLENALLGYTCYGPTPLTRGTFDLYWVAVHPGFQRTGIGKTLVAMAEDRMRSMGGERVFVETASRSLYRPTRLFYERCGYVEAARLEDYYCRGDSKIIYSKRL